MKSYFMSLLMVSSFAVSAADKLAVGGLVKNKKTGEQITLMCADKNCSAHDLILITPEDSNSVRIKKLNKFKLHLKIQHNTRPIYDNLEMTFIKKTPENVEVLPEIYTGSYGTTGWFFNLTLMMWESVSYMEGEAAFVPSIIGASLATIPVAAVDIVGTAIIDSALIASYPVRSLVSGTKYTWKKGYKLVQVLESMTHREVKISDKKFKKLLKGLENISGTALMSRN